MEQRKLSENGDSPSSASISFWTLVTRLGQKWNSLSIHIRDSIGDLGEYYNI